MEAVIHAIAFAAGLVVGAVLLWVVMRAKLARAVIESGRETEIERATLNERVRSGDAALMDLRAACAQREQQLAKAIFDAKEIEKKLTQYGQAYKDGREAILQRDKQITDLNSWIGNRDSLVAELQGKISAVEAEIARYKQELVSERQKGADQLTALSQAEEKFVATFKALAADALSSSSSSFLELAKTHFEKLQGDTKTDLEIRQLAIDQMIAPVAKSLEKVDQGIRAIETARVGAYSSLVEQISSLVGTQKELRTETANLVSALRAPTVRGRWGEIQLRRVVELAGMVDHCDFREQQSVDTEDGRLRPDLLVNLPAGKTIVVDAKAPLMAYLEALEVDDEANRSLKLREHAKQIRAHIVNLGRKSYFEQFAPSPEFVVLFLPGEAFFCAALMHDPELIEYGVDNNVIIATPTTLIALLRAVAYGWRQETLAQNAKDISDLGRELHKRCSDMAGHFARLGDNLRKTTEFYNKAVGSLESRVLVTARKFADLGAAGANTEIEESEQIEIAPRAIQAPELLLVASNDADDGVSTA